MYSDYEKMANAYKGNGIKDKILENWAFVDSIDLEPYINTYTDLNDLISAVDDDYYKQVVNNETMEGCVFNWISEDELSLYIRNKYKIWYKETTRWERFN